MDCPLWSSAFCPKSPKTRSRDWHVYQRCIISDGNTSGFYHCSALSLPVDQYSNPYPRLLVLGSDSKSESDSDTSVWKLLLKVCSALRTTLQSLNILYFHIYKSFGSPVWTGGRDSGSKLLGCHFHDPILDHDTTFDLQQLRTLLSIMSHFGNDLAAINGMLTSLSDRKQETLEGFMWECFGGKCQ